MKLLTEKELNTIRRKAKVGHINPQEILIVFGHLDALEIKLNAFEEDETSRDRRLASCRRCPRVTSIGRKPPSDLRAISDSLNDERRMRGQSKLGWDDSTL